MAAATDHRSILPDSAALGLDSMHDRASSEEVQECIEVEEEEGREEHTESSSSSDEETVDDAMKEDMLKLEESFEDHGMKFRLIGRIGEGSCAPVECGDSRI